MAETTRFTIGVRARCADGTTCGHLTQVVIDPIDDKVTHVIIEPEHRQGLGRLVPVEWIEVHRDEVELHCTKAEFENLEIAEEIRFLPGSEGAIDDPAYDAEDTLVWPYFGGNTSLPVTVDTLPVGEVAIRRGDEVHATDGLIGQVEGLIVDSRKHHVTHVLLKEGHLFSPKKVAIPIARVDVVDESGVRLAISKKEVDALPPVETNRTDQ